MSGRFLRRASLRVTPFLSRSCHRCGMANTYNGNGGPHWPAKVRDVTENLQPVNAPSCYRASFLAGSLEVTARSKNVEDLDLFMNVLESHREFFVKSGRLAAEVLNLIESPDTRDAESVSGRA